MRDLRHVTMVVMVVCLSAAVTFTLGVTAQAKGPPAIIQPGPGQPPALVTPVLSELMGTLFNVGVVNGSEGVNDDGVHFIRYDAGSYRTTILITNPGDGSIQYNIYKELIPGGSDNGQLR